MIKSFSSILLVALFAQISLAKSLSNVFTAIKSITPVPGIKDPNVGTPFGFYQVKLGLDAQYLEDHAEYGDRFTLVMPDVLQVRTKMDDLTGSFDLKYERGLTFAQCEVNLYDELTETLILCEVVACHPYKRIQDEISIIVTFIGGGSEISTDLAERWKVGSNKIIFNQNIVGNLELSDEASKNSNAFGVYDPDEEYHIFYHSPESICPGGIESGNFECNIESDESVQLYSFQSFTSESINPFGQPTDSYMLEDSEEITKDFLGYSVSFGHIPGGYFIFDAFATSPPLNIKFSYTLTVQCASGSKSTDSDTKIFKWNGGYDTSDSPTDEHTFNCGRIVNGTI